jgi:putative endonuclease
VLARRRLGSAGEELAAEHLRSLGYQVVDRNFRCRRGEIDLVCRRGSEVALVEVKTRAGASRGAPVEALDERKRQAMAGTLAEYRAATGWRGRVRFKLVGITLEVLDDVLA